MVATGEDSDDKAAMNGASHQDTDAEDSDDDNVEEFDSDSDDNNFDSDSDDNNDENGAS